MKRELTKKFKSLTSIFILSLILINAVLIPALFYGMFSVVKQTNTDNFINQARLGSLLIATMTRSTITENDKYLSLLENLVENTLLNGDIVYLDFIVDEHTILNSVIADEQVITFKEDFQFSDHGDDTYFISVPLKQVRSYTNLDIRIGFDETFIKEQITSAFYQSLLIIILYVVLLLMVSYGLIRRIISPINKLRRSANDIAKGKIDTKLDTDSNILEINELSHDLIFMRDELLNKSSELEHLSLHDMLTGLPNRRMLNKQLSINLTDDEHNDLAFSLCILDLNRFKDINDTLGHHAGDAVLKTVADRIKSIINNSIFVSRLGGDEFAIIIYHADIDIEKRKKELDVFAKTLSKIICEPISLENDTVSVTASIGISFYPEHAIDKSLLLRLSDTAMYESKKFKNDYMFYHSDMGNEAQLQLQLRNDLKDSLAYGEFEVYYQAKISLSDGRLLGFEALTRWFPKHREAVGPDDFIPALEKMGLINKLTLFVLTQSVEQLKIWHETFPDLIVAINISAYSLSDKCFSENLLTILTDTQTKNEFLELELTESAVIDDPITSIPILEYLYNSGIKIAIDDFGTGYSSLSNLKELPATTLKIDKSFVMNMLTNGDDLSIVKAIIDMAHNLDLLVTAEGVENMDTMNDLARFGCDMAQGYFISKPLSAQNCLSFVKKYDRNKYKFHHDL
jgi:diguanylate cyclase (GGDEF)-like protein